MVTTEQKIMAAAAHCGYLLGGIGFIVLPLILWLINGRQSFAGHHARQAFWLQMLVLFGIVLFIILGAVCDSEVLAIAGCVVISLAWFILAVMALVKAIDGKFYSYPLPGLRSTEKME